MTGKEDQKSTLQNVIDTGLKIGIIFLIIAWCFQIIRPFIYIFIWGIIIAVTLYPLHGRLTNILGNRPKLAATVITILLMAIFILPAIFLAESMIDGIKEIGAQLKSGNFSIPHPPEKVHEWPLIGKWLYSTWDSASESLVPLLQKYKDQLVEAGQWVLNGLLGTGLGILHLFVSMIITGILLASSDKAALLAKNLIKKLAGSRGEEYTRLTEITIRNISKGILGVAAIQSLYLGLIFIIANIPYAGLWAIVCLILATIQVGPLLVTVPVIIYLYINTEPWLATIWTVLLIIGSLIDNFLKPVLMGKDAPVPMLIIFLGAIGGFITGGFIGLFIGAIALSIGYKLFGIWISEELQ
jgi:predicted PurR-regulated permease PerM